MNTRHPSSRSLSLAGVLSVVVLQLPGLTVGERAQIVDWLRCNDCLEHQRDTVVAIAVRKPQAAIDTLAGALIRGPDSTLVASVRAALVRVYMLDSAAAQQGSIPFTTRTRAQYVQYYLAGYDAKWRVRSAEALGYINQPRSDSMLDSAAGLTATGALVVSARVLRMIRYAHDSLP